MTSLLHRFADAETVALRSLAVRERALGLDGGQALLLLQHEQPGQERPHPLHAGAAAGQLQVEGGHAPAQGGGGVRRGMPASRNSFSMSDGQNSNTSNRVPGPYGGHVGRAVCASIATALIEDGHRLLVTGDMGIGNTTASAAVIQRRSTAVPSTRSSASRASANDQTVRLASRTCASAVFCRCCA